MPFNCNKFMNTVFVPREEDAKLSDECKSFFPEGELCVLKVRGLTGPELAEVHAAADKQKNLAAILEGLLSDANTVKVDAIRKAVGIEKGTPAETARRLELFVRGVVVPKVNVAFATKFCEKYPIDFYHVTNVITRLTGAGSLPGKPKPSGNNKK